jgi:hypothetical protein
MPRWARGLAAVVGLISLAAGILVLMFLQIVGQMVEALGFVVYLLAYLLAFGLVLLGVERLGMSITGHGFT